jgi:dephospho-CoA kinase
VIHRLYREPDVVGAVVRRFGSDVLGADGQVDRARLGRMVFGDPEGMAFLERLLHPRVGAERERWLAERAREPHPPAVVVCEVPLLFEVGAEDQFDVVAVVSAPEQVRRARVEARGQDFAARAARQLPEEAKLARADERYVNDGTLADLEDWVADVLARRGRGGGT